MQKRTTISYEHRLLYICITCTVFHKVSAFLDMIASLINHQFLELRWIFTYSTGRSCVSATILIGSVTSGCR